MKDGTFLFVTCPFGGTEVFMKNLRTYVESRGDIPSHWLEIPGVAPSMMRGFSSLRHNWTLRASGATFREIRELRRRGTIIKAAFFNHLTSVSTLLGYRQRIACILSMDTTPVLLNHDRHWYKPEGFQTRGITERLSQEWTRHTYAAMKYLLPWSKFVQNSLIDDYGVQPERAIVLPPGIDLAFWKPNNNRSERPNLAVLFVGGDFVRKGGDVLLQAALVENLRDVQFHFVTNSFNGPTPKNVHVYSGVTPNSPLLMKLYHESDVFVLPTKADYAPTNAVVEAFAMGLPVITTDVGGLGDLINDGENVFVVQRNDSGDLSQRLLRLKMDVQLLDRLKSNARVYAEQNFDINRSASRIVDLLREVSA